LQEVADQVLQKTGGNPLMIRVMASLLHIQTHGPYDVESWRSILIRLNDLLVINYSVLGMERYSPHPVHAYENTVNSMGREAQQVLAVLYHCFQALEKVPIADVGQKWQELVAVASQQGTTRGSALSPRDVHFRKGLKELWGKNAIETDQGETSCHHDVQFALLTLSCTA
jgi:hypothetical protein